MKSSVTFCGAVGTSYLVEALFSIGCSVTPVGVDDTSGEGAELLPRTTCKCALSAASATFGSDGVASHSIPPVT